MAFLLVPLKRLKATPKRDTSKTRPMKSIDSRTCGVWPGSWAAGARSAAPRTSGSRASPAPAGMPGTWAGLGVGWPGWGWAGRGGGLVVWVLHVLAATGQTELIPLGSG